ncbi:MAG: asparagine--tRNA ligase [Candidatus Njordarchaeales archaeon]
MILHAVFKMTSTDKLLEFKGWVVKKREHGKIIFLDMRTTDFPWRILQAVAKKGVLPDNKWNLLERVSQESSVVVRGELVKNPRAPGGEELIVKDLEITSVAESPYPLGKKEQPPDVLMRWRHLAIRSLRYTKIWVVRDALLHAAREYFRKNGWYEVSPPILVSTACEGGATLFSVNYFDNSKVYLSQSAQLYLEVMIFSLGKVWSLTPSFRAEKSRTRRHLAEYWHLEAEAAWYDLENILKVEEELIYLIIQKLLENDVVSKIIQEFRGSLDSLEEVKPPFKRVKYDEAIEILQSKGMKIKWGDDIGGDEEKILSEEIGEWFFLTHFPTHLKAFYVKVDEKRPEISLSADLLAPEGYGEIIGGSQREDNADVLIERIKAEGFDPRDYDWYLDLRRYGSVPHSGFGLGIERLLMWILKLDHIRDTLPFPRLARVKKFI